jgi:hypothetical protein
LNSQEKHLAELLEKNKMLEHGRVAKAKTKIAYKDHSEIVSVVEYIVEVHGYESLQPFFTQDLDSVLILDSPESRAYSYTQVSKILDLMAISYTGNDAEEDGSMRIDYTAEAASFLSITGYDYFIPDFAWNSYDPNTNGCSSYLLDRDSAVVCFHESRNQVTISYKKSQVLLFDLAPMVNMLRDSGYRTDGFVKTEAMSLTSNNEVFSAKVYFKNLEGNFKADSLKLSRMRADIIIRLGKETENEVGEQKQNRF